MRTRWILDLLVAGVVLAAAGRAQADEPNPAATPADAPADDDRTPTDKAFRDAYFLGVARSDKAQWGEALAAFEEAAAVRDGPDVQYSIGGCQRALRRYVAARRTFRRILSNTEGRASAKVLDYAKKHAAVLDQLVVRVAITLDPAGTPLFVDGSALRADTDGGTTVFVTLPGPPGAAAPTGKTFTVELDPGDHLFRATRPGLKDAFVQKTYRPGEKTTLTLHLDQLPAHVCVRAEPPQLNKRKAAQDECERTGKEPQAIVFVNNREAGLAPIDIERPAGKYKIEVVRDGFETHTATFDLHAGQRADLTAKLVPLPIFKKWWFWTGVAVVAAGGAVVTWALTRPDPPYNGGSLNWVAKPTAIEW